MSDEVRSAIFIKRAFIIPNFTSSVGHKTDSFRFNIPPIAEIIVAKGFFLTSSLRTPKFFVKEFSYFLMPCHQHGLRINLLVQR